MLSVLRQRNFALLWLAGLISPIGDWVLFIALPFYVYSVTGSALATGTMFIAQTVPRVVLGSVAGVFVDRWDRKRTMISTDLARAALLLLLLTVRSHEGLWVLYLVACVESVISQFFSPARDALLPHLVDEHRLLAANSLNSISGAITFLVGPSLGGALMGLLGLTSVVLVDSLSYLLSGMLILLISVPSAPSVEEVASPAATATWATIWREWLEGLRLVKREQLISILFVVMGTAAFAQGIINVLFVIFVKEVLRGGAPVFGWLVAIQGVGGLIGGFIIGHVDKVVPPTRLITVSEVAVGVIFLAMYSVPVLPLALVLSALLSVPATGYQVSTQTLLQTGVADLYRGRIFGSLGMIQSLFLLGGMGLASALGDRLGVVPLLDAAGGLFCCAGMVALALPRWPMPGTVDTLHRPSARCVTLEDERIDRA